MRRAAPIVIAVVVAIGVIVAFIFWATADIDRRSIDRETRLIAHVMAEQVKKLTYDQESIAIWDDAIQRTKLNYDPDWVDLNLGSWMGSYFGHDRVLILNAADTPIFAMADGEAVDPAVVAGEWASVAPLVARLRTSLAGGALQAYSAESGSAYPAEVDVTTIGGIPAIVGVLPLGSDSGAIIQDPGTEFLHVSAIFLDADYSQRLAGQYLLQDAAFAVTQMRGPEIVGYPILSKDGRLVAFFEWRPERPGQIMLSRIAPAFGLGLLIAAGAIFFLLDQLWRSAAALRAGRLKAQYDALHDPLTDLPNRTEFEIRLAEALNPARVGGGNVALLLLDLDRFKQVNDTLGHQAGDDLLRAVSQRLRAILPEQDMLARIGGDEFAVIHYGSGGEVEPTQVAQRLIDAAGKPFDLVGSETFVGLSVGIAIADHERFDRLELTRRADIALFEAKAAGRNRAVVFEDAMNELLQGRHSIESELREALRKGTELTLAFQPLFGPDGRTVTGAEALARWTHPRLGTVSPALFIPVAEATGLIEALGDFVLLKSCELGARWPGLKIAVNISPAQLRCSGFPARVFELLAKTGMRPQDLELEITEGILLEDSQVVTEALATLRSAGMRIALDDFGTGYSSLNYLKRYPVDSIKIDRSFVTQLVPGNVSVAIVQAMVTLAHTLKVEVTAEGVETAGQMEILQRMRCDTFQGFLLSTPIPGAALDAVFREHAAAPRAVPQVA